MSALIGALRVSLSADSAVFEKGMSRAEKKAKASSSAIQRSLGGIKTGLAALATGISLAAIGAVAKQALDYASSLGEVSQQLGVTTRDLQVFRFAATQTGLSQEEMDKALGRLRVTLGQVAAGAKAPIAALKAIGIEAKDLAGRDTGQALRVIADGLSRISDSSERAAVEVALFGRTGANLDTLLSGGRSAIDELANAADRLGIVLSDAQIQKADETADKLAAVKQVLEARIAGVVSDNANSILDLVDALAQLVTWAGKAASAWRSYNLEIEARGLQNTADGWFTSNSDRMKALTRISEIRDEQFQIARNNDPRERERASTLARIMSTPIPGTSRNRPITKFLDTSGGGGGGRGKSSSAARDAERAAEERQREIDEGHRRRHEIESELRQEKINELQASRAITYDAEQRHVLAQGVLDLENEQLEADARLSVLLRERTQAEADALIEAQRAVISLERRALDEEESRRIAQEELQLAGDRRGLAIDLAEIDANLAETASERRAAELRLLDLVFEQERARLEAVAADKTLAEATRQAARERLAALGTIQAGAQEEVVRSTRGPLESFLAEMPTTAAKANEALERVAVGGLQSLTDGLTDAIMGAKSLGDVFSNVAKQIIADLIRIQLQRAIVGALSGALGGGGGFSGGVPPGFGIPGFKNGGTGILGGRSGVDTNILSANGSPIARYTSGERLTVTPNGGSSAAPIVVHQHYSFEGVAITQEQFVRGLALTKSETIKTFQDMRSRRAL